MKIDNPYDSVEELIYVIDEYEITYDLEVQINLMYQQTGKYYNDTQGSTFGMLAIHREQDKIHIRYRGKEDYCTYHIVSNNGEIPSGDMIIDPAELVVVQYQKRKQLTDKNSLLNILLSDIDHLPFVIVYKKGRSVECIRIGGLLLFGTAFGNKKPVPAIFSSPSTMKKYYAIYYSIIVVIFLVAIANLFLIFLLLDSCDTNIVMCIFYFLLLCFILLLAIPIPKPREALRLYRNHKLRKLSSVN